MKTERFLVTTSHDARKSGPGGLVRFQYCRSEGNAKTVAQEYNEGISPLSMFLDKSAVLDGTSGSHLEFGVVDTDPKLGYGRIVDEEDEPPIQFLGQPIRIEAPLKDLKEGLSSVRKPDITHMRTPLMVYGARAGEYGDDKYIRSNYLRPAGTGYGDIKAEFKRHRAYLRAVVSHTLKVLDAMELHQSKDPHLEDFQGMIDAVSTPDMDTTPGAKVGPSKLPHHCGAIQSFNMAMMQGVTYGLLTEDPGTPWRE